MKPKLVYYEILRYLPDNMQLLYDHFNVVELSDPSHDSPEVLYDADVILAPLGFFLGKEKLDIAPSLKVIGSNTTGYPHIDVNYARQLGIKVVTLKDHQDFLDSITPTSELAWGLVIALTRNIMPAFQSVLKGKWERWPYGGKRMLSRMSLGVAGYGRLGKKVAAYGACFGMKVFCFDPFVNKCQTGVQKINTLKQLVSLSDIVTVHIPHEPETENMFNNSIFAHFKKGSYFINTSRSELVDHRALLETLISGKLAGAAIDVIDDEFEPGFENRVLGHPLIRYAAVHSNLIITPHIGGSTTDAWSLTQEYTIKKIIEAIGKK